MRHAAHTLQAGSDAKVVRCCRRDATLSAPAPASASASTLSSARLSLSSTWLLASLGLCQNIFVAALNEFNDAAPLPATLSSWLSLAIRLTVYLGSCCALRLPIPLPSSVCPSVSLSVCVSRCLPYAAPCLRMHVAFSGGRACTDRCIDMPKR